MCSLNATAVFPVSVDLDPYVWARIYFEEFYCSLFITAESDVYKQMSSETPPVSAIYKRVLSIQVRSQAMTVRLYSERFVCQKFDIDNANMC